jgi:hypothetical protein
MLKNLFVLAKIRLNMNSQILNELFSKQSLGVISGKRTISPLTPKLYPTK